MERSQSERRAPTELSLLLADGTTIRFYHLGRGFWAAWPYLRGRCTRVKLFGEEIPISRVSRDNPDLRVVGKPEEPGHQSPQIIMT